MHVSASSILISFILWNKVLYMHKIFKYMMQTSDAIVIGERRRYLDPTAIYESRHAGPSKWTDDDDMLAGCETPACGEEGETN